MRKADVLETYNQSRVANIDFHNCLTKHKDISCVGQFFSPFSHIIWNIQELLWNMINFSVVALTIT